MSAGWVLLCRGSVRLYSDFYESDIIVASPLALATKLSEDEEEGEQRQHTCAGLIAKQGISVPLWSKFLQNLSKSLLQGHHILFRFSSMHDTVATIMTLRAHGVHSIEIPTKFAECWTWSWNIIPSHFSPKNNHCAAALYAAVQGSLQQPCLRLEIPVYYLHMFVDG